MNKNAKDSLFGAYYRAEAALIQARESEFPVGSTIRCKLTGEQRVVTAGSLYAHQVNTESGHVGWWHCEKIERPGGE